MIVKFYVEVTVTIEMMSDVLNVRRLPFSYVF